MYKIRFANAMDIGELTDHLVTFAKEYGGYGEPKWKSIERNLEASLSNPDYISLVATKDLVVVGLIIGIVSPLMFDWSVKQSNELAWYVTPDHRDSRVGLELFNSFEKVSINRGVKYINMVSPLSLEAEKLNKLYTRKGYKLQETTWTKEV